MFDRAHFRRPYRYSRWDGTQRLDDLDAEGILDALADDYLKQGDLRRALERMMREGFRRRDGERQMGLRELMERLRDQKQQRMRRYDMDGVMGDILEKLEHIKQLERVGIERRVESQAEPRPTDGPSAAPESGTKASDGPQQAGDEVNESAGDSGETGEPGGADEFGDGGAPGQGSGRGQRGRADQAGQRGAGSRGQGGERGQSGQAGQSPRAGQAERTEQASRGASGSQPGPRDKDSQSGTPADQIGGGEGVGGASPSAGKSGDAPEGLDTEALRRTLRNIAQRKLDFLDQLPEDPAGQIKQLTEYDFMDDQAREEFQQLLAMLQQQVMRQYFQGMQQAIQNMTPEDLARMREMVRELNRMLRERAEGGEPDFDEFMRQYGDFFGPGINTLDDLIDQLQRGMAQMQAVMDSMTPEQRAQLEDMIDELIGDDRLRVDLSELAMNMEAFAPEEGTRGRYRLTGEEPLSLAEAMNLMGVLRDMDALERQLQEARRTGEVDGVDLEQLRDLVGNEEAQALEQLQALLKQLEDEGYVRRHGNRLELTSRGVRRIGQKALEDIFSKLQRDGFGRHRLVERGVGGERLEESKPYAFGDPFHLDLERTVMNGVRRQGSGTPVRLDAEDFAVYRTELLTTSSTVLMLDMSWSMLMNGLWQPAKKVAIALESLIRGQFPRDNLAVVGFANIAREYKPEELVELSQLDHVQGTNMVHGLALARQILARTHARNKQIIMITDGGPTVWYEDGDWRFNWPPPPEATAQTLREVHRATKDDITINVFMLWDDAILQHFVNQMAGINRGRAFFVSPEDLGEYIVIDYLNQKRKRVS